MTNKLFTKIYAKAKADGRLCTRCGWIVTKKDAAKGHTVCASCRDALQGVNVSCGWDAPLQERKDVTGEML